MSKCSCGARDKEKCINESSHGYGKMCFKETSLLDEYSKELDLTSPMSLESLIQSHKTLRQMRLDVEEERNKYVQSGFEQGYKSAIQTVDNEYISISKLKTMTITQLVWLLEEH